MTSEFKLSPFTLRFYADDVETRYRDYDFQRLRQQGRVAILVGMTVYLLYGILDIWFVPAAVKTTVWLFRLSALLVPAIVFALSFHALFQRHVYELLALVGLAAGSGLLAMLYQLPVDTAVYYYVGLVLTTFYTYNFIGTRFIYAVCVDIGFLLTYNLLFGWWREFPMPIMINHDFFILSANLIGGVSGYLVEQHRRELFVHKQVLEQERHFHQQLALHDPLTRLPNRVLLFDRLECVIANAFRGQQLAAGIYIDLDDFKSINDIQGHACGDWVLQEVAHRLSTLLRDTDTVCRLGGDEYFVLVPEIDSHADVEALEAKIAAAIQAPMQPPGISQSLSVHGSLGSCIFPFSGCSASEIVGRADKAMYQQKQQR
ncbi:GGDEF domain-containing protein [Methylomonas sp. AM2-LC]|uniref:GGDEF domain-containing protein n=1 Tax=Methylomonas sp. AM2-LC TaxID=3153301 RepID=UPI00326698A2